MFTSDEWTLTTECIAGLYPKWSLTDEQARAFRERFQALHQDSLREAVKRLWIEDKFGGSSPNPGKLGAMYGRVRDEGEAVARAGASREQVGANVDWDDVRRNHENILRKVLMAGVSVCSLAANMIRSGAGRWGWIRPQRCEGDDPNRWSTMMQAAVLYEIENPTESAKEGDDEKTDARPLFHGDGLTGSTGLDHPQGSGEDLQDQQEKAAEVDSQ